jgi:SAM-dependent methyltransferase
MNCDIKKGYCPFCLEATDQKSFKWEPATHDPDRVDFANLYVDLVRCRQCAAVFVRRNLSRKLIEKYYSAETSGSIPANMENFYWWLQNTEMAFKDILRHIAKEPRGPLLDVGCGRGTLLYLARQQGWAVTGLEINAEMARFVSQELAVTCILGTSDNNDLPKNYYGVITLLDVLEHLYDPVKILRRCRELLRPGGVVIVKCPYWRMQYLKEQIRYWVGLGSGDIANIGHINQFSPLSLGLALRRAGFQLIGFYPAQNFLPAIRGTSFNLKRTIEYGITEALNILIKLIFKIFRVNLSFSILGLARKPMIE